MQRVILTAIVLALWLPPASASGMRFCDLKGTIQTAEAIRSADVDRAFDLSVLIADSQLEKGRHGKMGYTDCREFVGETIVIRLQIPERLGDPSPGDLVAFNYSAIDGFGVNGGYAGTSVNASLHTYNGVSSRRSD
jgi:hypothetical protein